LVRNKLVSNKLVRTKCKVSTSFDKRKCVWRKYVRTK
jgi:hypothetical protein